MPTATTNALVASLLGRTFTAAEQTRADQLITWAEAQISAHCRGLTFGETDDEEATIYGDGDSILWLPKFPVRAVASVAIGGTALDSSEYRFTQLGQLERIWSSIGSALIEPGQTGRWPDAGVAVVVTYSYGWASGNIPEEVQLVATDLAASRFVNPEKVSQESIGDRSVSFAGNAGANAGGISGFHESLLRDWCRHSAFSSRQRSS